MVNEGLELMMLPSQLMNTAPRCWEREKLWFDKESGKPGRRCSDYDIVNALVSRGVGEYQCPTVAEWVAFSGAGAIIATLSGKYITPPDPEPLDWANKLEYHIWEALWQAIQGNETKLNRIFIAAMMRSFLPRLRYTPPERPYFMSNFVFDWRSNQYTNAILRSVDNLCPSYLQRGREVMNRLPPPVAASIIEAARHLPPMLEIVIKRIRRTYHW